MIRLSVALFIVIREISYIMYLVKGGHRLQAAGIVFMLILTVIASL